MADAKTHFEQGQEYRKQGKLDEAIAEFKEAIQLNPLYTEAHREYIGMMLERGEKAEILVEYQVKVQQHPDSEVHHYLLGRVLDDVDDKLREFKEAIEINPNYPWGHYGLGWVYRSKEMLDEAIAEYKEAIKINPDFAEAHYNLGMAYKDQGKLDYAIKEYHEAIRIKLDPSYEAAHDDYIDLMKKRGRHAEVRAEYEEKAEAQPDNKLWGKLLERVPAIRKRLISPMCALCIGRGVFRLVYLQFILLLGISVGIASFARELIPFSSYLALTIYVAIISAIQAPSDIMVGINKFFSERADKDVGLATKLIGSAAGGLVGLLIASLIYMPIAILTYVAMRIFHANWWIPIAVLGVFYIIVPRELMALKNPTWKPIENPILVERLTGFIERGNVKVKIKNILRMDADKPPAGVAGLLLPKRILFSNSILQRFSIPELEAVFAHELGHVKTGFVQKKFLVQSVLIFVRLYLANLIYGILLPVYGFSGPEQIAALPLLAFCWLILGLPVRAIQSSVSQYFERKADQYAISEVGESLFSSTFDKILETRQEQTLSPIFNFVCYAHPCREERMHISRHKNSEEGKDESF